MFYFHKFQLASRNDNDKKLKKATNEEINGKDDDIMKIILK